MAIPISRRVVVLLACAGILGAGATAWAVWIPKSATAIERPSSNRGTGDRPANHVVEAAAAFPAIHSPATEPVPSRMGVLAAPLVLSTLALAIGLLVVAQRRRETPRTSTVDQGAAPPRDAVLRPVRSDQWIRADASHCAWTADRLRKVVRSAFGGERVIVVANREPVIHEVVGKGAITARRPAGGLVSALEPVVSACNGVWVGHGSGSADRLTVDADDGLELRCGEHAYRLRRVWLDTEEERGYYSGFANEALWPLCHMAHVRPVFRIDDFHTYWQVNERFTEAVRAEARSDAPVVLVQDYHFALVPRMLRTRRPRATIVSFWHIPWPHAEFCRICPWNHHILEGLLGSTIVGFHTAAYCRNFLETIERCLVGARVDWEQQSVQYGGRRILVRAYPISVAWPCSAASGADTVEECRRRIRAELDLPLDAIVCLGVDRMDYTKGLEEKLAAVERLLERQPTLRRRFALVQIAAPSRDGIAAYDDFRERVRGLTRRINERFGTAKWMPVRLIERSLPAQCVFEYFRAADVCYVASLHDGMNLVAKEFVSARDDLGGVLVLSQFTGAASELSGALIVNPYDTEGAAQMLEQAIEMDSTERQARMVRLRAIVAEFNAYRWASEIVQDAAHAREREW